MKRQKKKLIFACLIICVCTIFKAQQTQASFVLGDEEKGYGLVAFSPNNDEHYLEDAGDTMKEGNVWGYWLTSACQCETKSFDESIIETLDYGEEDRGCGTLTAKTTGKVKILFHDIDCDTSAAIELMVVHDFDRSAREEVLKKGTCTQGAIVKKYCKYCKEWVEDEQKPTGHQFKNYTADNEHAAAYKRCAVCGEEQEMILPQDFRMEYYEQKIGNYSIVKPKFLEEGTPLKVRAVNFVPDNIDSDEIVITSNNESVLKVEGMRLQPLKEGKATVTFAAKYNPAVSYTETFEVRHVYLKYMPDRTHAKAYKQCMHCGYSKAMDTLRSFEVYWNFQNGIGDFINECQSSVKRGTEFFYAIHDLAPENPDDKEVVVTSSNKNILAINPTTKSIKAVGVGTATITFSVKYNPSIKKSYSVYVPGATIKLSATSKKIKKKKSFTLTVGNLAAGDKVAKVSANNRNIKITKVNGNKYKIKGTKKGKSTVTVVLVSGKKAICKVRVK